MCTTCTMVNPALLNTLTAMYVGRGREGKRTATFISAQRGRFDKASNAARLYWRLVQTDEQLQPIKREMLLLEGIPMRESLVIITTRGVGKGPQR